MQKRKREEQDLCVLLKIIAFVTVSVLQIKLFIAVFTKQLLTDRQQS